jgi:hypothetical protein
LLAHPHAVGVRGRYSAHPAENGDEPRDWAHERLHSSLSFEWRWHDDDRPPDWFAIPGSVAEWKATVAPGWPDRGLRLQASVPAQVFVDGRLVIDHPGDYGSPTDANVTFERPAALTVQARIPAGVTPEILTLRLLWEEPGGGWTAFMPYLPGS